MNGMVQNLVSGRGWQLVVDPLLPDPVMVLLALLALAAVIAGFAMRLRGAVVRMLAALAVLVALLDPSIQRHAGVALSDIVLVAVDRSASNRIRDREDQTDRALAALRARIATMPGTELREVEITDDPDDGGTRAMAALSQAMVDIPPARLAGVFLISDGQVHDAAAMPALPAPLHLLRTGEPDDWDRRLVVVSAPAFAIVGEPLRITLRIEDQGIRPGGIPPTSEVTVRVGAEPRNSWTVPVGQDLDFTVDLEHGGMNLFQVSIPELEGELTGRNNQAVVAVNGVRDRLRVLLVSGEPHAGERVWRNLLKSDAAVDLVHFTILRPPEKQDGVPVSELALIAFPTRELFVDKIHDFDLIIFDRYRQRGIMPIEYMENVRDYVRGGGAVLLAAGPEFGGVDSLWRSPLSEILPVTPTSRVIERGFRPALTEAGRRHPVTADIAPAEGDPEWGRWFRQIEMRADAGQVVMEGVDGLPLLVLDRVGDGRVAMLGSDHIWLWGRGYEGGGPQLELMRRLAHWTMKEPELEEERLTATARGDMVTITRRTLGDRVDAVTIRDAEGGSTLLPLLETGPGQWQGQWQAPAMGLHELTEGDLATVIVTGPAAPREFEATIASSVPLADALAATGGTSWLLSDGQPDIRRVASGRQVHGRGWLGITPREAEAIEALRIRPLLPGWGWLLICAGLVLAAWMRESGRAPRRAD